MKQLFFKKIKKLFLYNPMTKYDSNLTSGSKNLKKYIEFFKVQKFFLKVYKLALNTKLPTKKLQLNTIMIAYNKLYLKFLIRLFIKLIRFNFLFSKYKKMLLAVNNTNVINLLSVLNFGKKNIKSSPSLLVKNKFYIPKVKPKKIFMKKFKYKK
jgi:hypothetical protein